MQVIARHGHPVVLEYGLYVATTAIALLQTLKDLGAEPWCKGSQSITVKPAWRAENRNKPTGLQG